MHFSVSGDVTLGVVRWRHELDYICPQWVLSKFGPIEAYMCRVIANWFFPSNGTKRYFNGPLIRIWNKWERVNFFKDQKNTLDKNWLLKASDHTLATEVRRRHWPRSSETWKRLKKFLMIFGDLRRLSQVFGNLRKCLGDLRKCSEVIGDLRKFSEIFVWSSVISRRFRTIFRNLRKVSHDLRRSSKYISWPSAVFECVRFNFGNLRCNLHSCYTFQHYVNKKCTPF